MMSFTIWFLFVAALSIASVRAGDENANSLRLFPAAKQERYDAQTTLLRTIQTETLEFVLSDSHPVVEEAKRRFQEYLQNLPDYPEEYPVNPKQQQLVPVKGIKLSVQDKNPPPNPLPAKFDESYQIQIDSQNDVILVDAMTVFGIVRALESLAQLTHFGWMETINKRQNAVHVIANTPLFIADAPTFSYRGLMIDTARHYQPLDLILHNIDVMAMNKFNLLHWHVTDDQSWPFVSQTYPEISQKGAYHPHSVYTHEDVQKVIDAAYLRGIRVIPEFDLPGHSNPLGLSHPDLMSQCEHGSKSPFTAPLNPTLPQVYKFVENLYQEVTTLFVDEYIHIGGDEVRLDCWKQDPAIQKWAKAHNAMTEKDLLNYFESILTDIVAACGKTPIAWQELLNEGVDLPPGTVIDVWKGFDNDTIIEATQRGYPVVISGCWYLDHLKDDWKTYYECEPLRFNGTQAQKELILGGHASMWGERVDATDFMERVWPRASAVAERLWSGSVPKSYHDQLEETVEDRIAAFRCFLVLRGVSAAPIAPGSCSHEQPPNAEAARIARS